MKLKSIKDIKNLSGKRVLLRLDVNVPLKDAQVVKEGAWRLERSLPTIKYLLSKKAKVIIFGHLGRPEGKRVKEFSLLPVVNYFSKLLKKDIEFFSDDFRTYVKDSKNLKNGQIAVLENIRFEPREKENDKRLAKNLSQLADIYVNDAFGNVHRQDASMHAITYFLPSYAGLLLEDEVKHLSQVLESKNGLAIIFGGAKVETKLKLIEISSKKAESVLVGGALANTILAAAGHSVGKSLVDKSALILAKKLTDGAINMPIDVRTAKTLKSKTAKTFLVSQVPKNYMILDIGPKTVKKYISILKSAKLIVWNGPFGYFENKIFVAGSREIMKALAKTKAKVIIGGGETVELARQLKLDKKFDFISTGGGAMLTFLQGEKMPVLERLKSR